MKRITSLLCSLTVCFTLASDYVAAQSHFTDCSTRTGVNATVVLPAEANPTIDGNEIAIGDEVAVFTAEGLCVGVTAWTGVNVPLTVWGDDVMSAGKNGLAVSEPMRFRVWDASTKIEHTGESVAVSFSSAKPYYTAEASFVENGIYVIQSLQVTTTPEITDAATIKRTFLLGQHQNFVLEQNYPNPFSTSTT